MRRPCVLISASLSFDSCYFGVASALFVALRMTRLNKVYLLDLAGKTEQEVSLLELLDDLLS